MWKNHKNDDQKNRISNNFYARAWCLLRWNGCRYRCPFSGFSSSTKILIWLHQLSWQCSVEVCYDGQASIGLLRHLMIIRNSFSFINSLVIDIPDRLMTQTLKPITINMFFPQFYRVLCLNEALHWYKWIHFLSNASSTFIMLSIISHQNA